MRISDWSSDVCSSDLKAVAAARKAFESYSQTSVRERLDLLETIQAEYIRRERELGEAITERSEEHTSELQSLMRISYAVFCLKKKKKKTQTQSQIIVPTTKNKHNNITQQYTKN